jgi:hypothetical protein
MIMLDQANAIPTPHKRLPWNKGKLTGAKPPLRPKPRLVYSARSCRSKAALATSPCSIWRFTVSFVAMMLWPSGSRMSPPPGNGGSRYRPTKENRAARQIRNKRQTRQAIDDYLKAANKRPGEFLFTGRRGVNASMTTRQYARLVSEWIGSVGLES